MKRMILSFGLFFLLAGCTTTVTPPPQLKDPVTVYLTDQTIHSSVLLPVGDGKYMEYAKGDWNYAAKNNHWPWDVVVALFFSPQGALGRRVLTFDPAHPEKTLLLNGTPNAMQVERADVQVLLVDLDARFMKGDEPTENPDNKFVFRRVSEGYSLFDNCNSLTKRLLLTLHCKVQSRSFFALYHVEAAPVVAKPALASQSP
ncbi:hypothetical protein BH10PLA1_BH10PLA1_12280 [soil metagenome]